MTAKTAGPLHPPSQMPLIADADMPAQPEGELAKAAGTGKGPVSRQAFVLTWTDPDGTARSASFAKMTDAMTAQTALPPNAGAEIAAVRHFLTASEWRAAGGT